MHEDEALVRALRVLQASTAGVEGLGYYGALVRGLAEAVDMRFALVAGVASGEVCLYRSGVARLFPRDALLVDMKIERYVGVPIGQPGEVLGIIVAFDPEPRAVVVNPAPVLTAFAARAGWLIERTRLI